MAIFTPSGLKIRIPIDFSFAIMSRIFPKVKAYDILRVTEVYELLPTIWTDIFALMYFWFNMEQGYILYTAAFTQVLFHRYRLGISFPPKLLVSITRKLTLFHGYGIMFIIVLIVGAITIGWKGLLFFFIGKFGGTLINAGLSHFHIKKFEKMIGVHCTMSEINFFNACNYWGYMMKVNIFYDVTDEEFKEENWSPCFVDFAEQCPESVARFTVQ